MKRLISLLLWVGLLSGTGWYEYQKNFGSRELYTKVTHDGQMINEGTSRYGKIIYYKYKLPSYDEDNKKYKLTFNSTEGKKIKKHSYLLLHYNDKKGVLGWEQIDASNIPKHILNSLNH
ncbi:YxeA family protein [Enterococcus gilvus]|uniref:YxeA family protein n=1 Tax=Enterococcus gilvus TaxID=160453 RepID=UPI003EDA9C45